VDELFGQRTCLLCQIGRREVETHLFCPLEEASLYVCTFNQQFRRFFELYTTSLFLSWRRIKNKSPKSGVFNKPSWWIISKTLSAMTHYRNSPQSFLDISFPIPRVKRRHLQYTCINISTVIIMSKWNWRPYIYIYMPHMPIILSTSLMDHFMGSIT
jgi:hypothetical protein